MFSPQMLDHFQSPRNVGELDPADARAEVTNPVCGDVLRLTLRIEDNIIIGSRFKAQGCVPTVACGSVLTELICGMSVADARSLDSSSIIAVLGRVPQASTHAAELALVALSAALKDWED
jgi:nitrogen fixation NifU-like protein